MKTSTEHHELLCAKIRRTANKMADNIVNAYIEHDKGHFNESSHLFLLVFREIFPECTEDKLKIASESYLKALQLQDLIENDDELSKKQKLNHNGWKDVKDALTEFCRSLNIPESYANETANFFKYHGVRDGKYVEHVLKANRILSERITCDDYWTNITGGLYLASIDCHDKHDKNGLETGKELIGIYFEKLLIGKMIRDTERRRKIW